MLSLSIENSCTHFSIDRSKAVVLLFDSLRFYAVVSPFYSIVTWKRELVVVCSCVPVLTVISRFTTRPLGAGGELRSLIVTLPGDLLFVFFLTK